MRADIEREVLSTAMDNFGLPVTVTALIHGPPDPAAAYPDEPYVADTDREPLPCVAWPRTERYLTQDGKVMTVTHHTMLVPRAADVRAGDTVLNIRERSGEVIVGNRLLVAGDPRRRRDHQELTLEERT